MKNSTQPQTWVRVVNGLAALAFATLVLASYWPSAKVLGLWRADLGIQGKWIGGHAQEITAVTSGGPAHRAGLAVGDVLEFDPAREVDWVLAGYHEMPAGFTADVPTRHADGTRAIVSLAPKRVAYLPTLNDRLAYLARLGGLTIAIAAGVFMVWARPGLMTWALLLAFTSSAPAFMLLAYNLAFKEGPAAFSWWPYLPLCTPILFASFPAFGMSFPYGNLRRWGRSARAAGISLVVVVAALATYNIAVNVEVPFETRISTQYWLLNFAVAEASLLTCIVAQVWTYRSSSLVDRARLKWALLGMVGALAPIPVIMVLALLNFWLVTTASGSGQTAFSWAVAVTTGIFYPLALGMAVLRDRVVDIQFAISRTVVYGSVSTVVLVFLAALHWLLGRMIEHSGFAFGVEGLAAVGLGLVLHRASHGINITVDRVLFRKHHAAEERLRQVTAALPFASTPQSIAEAIVEEPARNLELASAALFYRESAEDPLRRVRAVGWGESHAATLDAESLLVRYLQAEHAALRLDDAQEWLPAGMPEGVAHPVLAIPIVTQHVLTAVVLYGAHVNSTLPDPDEVVLLEALAKAAATSHSQVRIAILMREKAAAERDAELLARENAVEKERNRQLAAIVQARMTGAHEGSA